MFNILIGIEKYHISAMIPPLDEFFADFNMFDTFSQGRYFGFHEKGNIGGCFSIKGWETHCFRGKKGTALSYRKTQKLA